MSDSYSQFEEVLVDEQMVTIPAVEAWQEIARTSLFLGVPVYLDSTKRLVLGLLDFVSKHKEEFRLGMFRSRGLRSWTVLPLLLIEGRLQRVHIEHVTCVRCGWRGAIANPTEPSLYFGVPDEVAVLQGALTLPRTGCPTCCAPLPRVAAWAGEDEGVSDNG